MPFWNSKPDPAEEFSTALEMASMLFENERFDEAFDAAVSALELAEDAFGPAHESVFEALSALCDITGEQGDAAAAEPFARRRVEVGTMLWGADDDRVGQALFELSVILRVLGNDVEAEVVLRRLLAHSGDAETADRVTLRGSLGDVLVTLERFEEAETLLQEAVELVFSAGLFDDSDALEAVWSLTALLRLQERPREAMDIARQVLDEMGDDPQVSAMDRALAHNALALAAGDLERYAEARSAADEAVRLALSLSEDDLDPRAVTLLENLADHFEDTGDLELADETWGRAVELAERLFGSGDAHFARLLGERAVRLYRRGDAEAAEPFMTRALAVLEALKDADPDELGIAYNRMAGIASDMGRAEEAELLQRKALALAEQVYGPDDGSVAVCLTNLGRILIDNGDANEAVALIERAIEITRAEVDSDPVYLVTPYLRLGEALLAQERPEEAAAAFSDAIAHAERGGDVFSEDVGEAYFLLGVTALSADDFETAERQLECALDIRQTVLGATAPETAYTGDMLAIALRGAGKLDEAEAAARRAVAAVEDAGIDGDPRLCDVLGTLGSVLLLQERFPEALDVLARAVTSATSETDLEALAWARDGLGAALIEEERYEEAEAVFGRNLAVSDGDDTLTEIRTSALAGLAAVARHTGRFHEAESLLREAIELHAALSGPDDPELAFGYGRLAEVLDALHRDDERDLARNRARTLALRLDPEDEDVRELLERLDDLG